MLSVQQLLVAWSTCICGLTIAPLLLPLLLLLLVVCICYCRIKDKSGRRPDDPEYDPRTLLIPNAASWFKQAKVRLHGCMFLLLLCCCLWSTGHPCLSALIM
jgi:hypothetical protein